MYRTIAKKPSNTNNDRPKPNPSSRNSSNNHNNHNNNQNQNNNRNLEPSLTPKEKELIKPHNQSKKSLNLSHLGQSDISRNKILNHFLESNKKLEEAKKSKNILNSCYVYIIKKNNNNNNNNSGNSVNSVNSNSNWNPMENFKPIDLEKVRTDLLIADKKKKGLMLPAERGQRKHHYSGPKNYSSRFKK